MKFCEKLDFVMKITNTTNSALARVISIDPSLVSRLRRGVRNPAKKENYLKPMAAYFAGKCDSHYQKTALRDVLTKNSNSFSGDPEQFTGLIYRWFIEEKLEHSKSVENLFQGLTRFNFKKTSQILSIDPSTIPENTAANGAVFYGIEGKQAAVINLLSLVIKEKKPATLLLYSDEDMEWMTENSEFAAKGTVLLLQFVKNGGKIKIIHTVNRDLDEILSSVKKWLPIYMTGAIEPYYYPKTRDGIFKRTLFIAPGTAAVTSNSIGNSTAKAANFLFTDKNTISALTEEYNEYLSLCRPLMRIFNSSSKEEFLSVLSEFEKAEGNRILHTKTFSTVTIPLDLAERICSRLGTDKDRVLSYEQMRIKRFEESLQSYKFTEIVPVPDVQAVCEGKLLVGYSQIHNINTLFYTPKEFCRHLQNIIRLLQTFDKYNLYPVNADAIEGMTYVQEDVGVIFGKIMRPDVLFATNESNITAAFWEYLRVMQEKLAKIKDQKKMTIDLLNAMVEKLNNGDN